MWLSTLFTATGLPPARAASVSIWREKSRIR
ncbi:Uncharacterised protein [Bordetella pertussis]|nr:Uncharacterised protein [Bordetella pertussis]